MLSFYKAVIIPTIDGIITDGEWDDAENRSFYFIPKSAHPPDNITVFYKHNNTHIFIAYDVLPDNTTEDNDAGFLYLDLNNDRTRDLRFEMTRNSGIHVSQVGNYGPNCSDLVWTYAVNNCTFPLGAKRNHTTIEMRIAIDLSTGYSGQSLTTMEQLPFANRQQRILFGGYGTLSPHWFYGNNTAIPNNDPDQGTNSAGFAIFQLFNFVKSVPSIQLNCYNAQITPTIDGVITDGEWSDADYRSFYFVPNTPHPSDYITVFYKHNNTHLFLAYDVLPDNTSEDDDAGFIWLDLNNDGIKDIRVQIQRVGTPIFFDQYYGNCSALDWAYVIGNSTFPLGAGRNHTTIEIIIAINRSTIFSDQSLTSATQLPFGSNSVKIVFGGSGTLSPTWFYGNHSVIPGNSPDSSSFSIYFADMHILNDIKPFLFTPLPLDSATGVELNPKLQVSVSDENGYNLTVYFYDNTTGTPTLLGTDTVSGGGPGNASITWNGRQYGTEYKWHVKVSDGLTNATSDTWSFTTELNSAPSVNTPMPADSATDVSLNPSLQVSVSDANGHDITVYFYDNTTGTPTLLGTDTVSGGGPGNASFTWNGRLYGTVYKWHVKVSDGLTNATTATWSFTTELNSAPSVNTPIPVDSAILVGLNLSLQVSVSDANGHDITVYFYDNTTGTPTLLGTDTVSGGGPGIATINWSGRQYSTVYKWYVKVSDGLTNATSATWSFTTRAIPLNLPEEGIPGYQTILLISILGVCVMILLRKMKKTYRKT